VTYVTKSCKSDAVCVQGARYGGRLGHGLAANWCTREVDLPRADRKQDQRSIWGAAAPRRSCDTQRDRANLRTSLSTPAAVTPTPAPGPVITMG
jgi:hypothetical protein